jgi:hypothetical protein
MENIVDSVSLPAGIYKVINYKQTATSTIPDKALIYSYKNRNIYYAKGVGRVLQSYVFADKQVFERRLLNYHIE